MQIVQINQFGKIIARGQVKRSLLKMPPANPVLLPESSVLRRDSRNQIPYCQIVHLSTKMPLLQAGKSVWSSIAALLSDTLTPTVPPCLAGAAGSTGLALSPSFGSLQNFVDDQMYLGILLTRVPSGVWHQSVVPARSGGTAGHMSHLGRHSSTNVHVGMAACMD